MAIQAYGRRSIKNKAAAVGRTDLADGSVRCGIF